MVLPSAVIRELKLICTLFFTDLFLFFSFFSFLFVFRTFGAKLTLIIPCD